MAVNIPPHNDDAERSVLGAALQKAAVLEDILEVLKEDDFYRNENKEIYKAMKELNINGSPVDTVTTVEELKKRKSLEMVGGTAYVFELPSFAPTVSNAGEYAKIIAEKSMLRQLIAASSDIFDKSYLAQEKAENVIDQAEQKIFEIGQNRQNKDYSSMEIVMANNLERIKKLRDIKGDLIGLNTGFDRLNKITSGFQDSDLIVLAARPGVGKTAFSLNVALNASMKEDATILFFSLEMAKEQLGQRLLSIKSKTELSKIRDGSVYNKPEEFQRLNDAMSELSKSKIYIDDTSGISIAEMKNKCRRLKASEGLNLVIIDYLQLMDLGEKVDSRVQEISTLTRRIKQLAREIDCPVVLLSQLSRDIEKRQHKKPQLSDLRESGSIEQDADLVIFLSRKEVEGEEEEGVRIVDIAKHRNGETGVIHLAWVGRFTQFSNLDPTKELEMEREAPF